MVDEKLEFGIIINYDPTPLNQAREDVAKVEAAFNDLKAQLKAAGAETSRHGSEFRKTAAAVKQAGAANRQASDDLRVLTRATLNQLQAIERRAIAEQEAALAQRAKFESERRGRTEAEKQLSAIRKVTAIEERRKIGLLALQEAQNRNITLTAAEARSLGGLSAAQLAVIEAEEKLLTAQAAKGDQNLRRIRAETRALEAQNVLLDEAARKKAFADVGLAPSGRPLQEEQAKEQEKINRQLTEANFRRFKNEHAEQIRLLKEKAQLEKQLTDPILQKRKAEVAILRERLALIEKAALAEARVAAGLAPPGAGGGGGGRGGRGGGQPSPAERNERFNRSLTRTQSLANRISFTFRRLFGILAAFTIARNLVRAFNDSLRSAIEFNARLEQAQLGMASLFLASGRVTNAVGDIVDGAEGLAIAQQEARRQTELLRVDALRTASTFEQLIENFQTATGPGLQAGLGLDEIRRITVRLSQAAATLGVPQRQLAEEIRSLLQGTIRVRDTRIAVALGITNADIRRAKELGVLAEFLEDRFSAFAESGKLVEQTFTVLLTNTRDALVQLAGAVGEGFFEEIKELLKDVKDSVVTLNEATGELEFNEEAIETATIFFDILKNAVSQARALGSSLDSDTFQQIGVALGRGLDVAFSALSAAIEIFVQGIQLASDALTVIFGTLTDIAKIFENLIPESMRRDVANILKNMLAIGIAAKGVSIFFRTVFSVVRGIAVLIPGLVLGFKGLAIAARSFGTAIALVIPELALLKGTLLVIGDSLKGILATTFAWAAAVGVVAAASKGLDKAFEKTRNIELKLERLRRAQSAYIKRLSTEFLDDDQVRIYNQALDTTRKNIKRLEDELAGIKNTDIFTRIYQGAVESISELTTNLISAVKDAANKAFDDTAFAPAEDRAEKVIALFKQTPGAVTAASRGLQAQQEYLKEIEDAAIRLNAEYALTKDFLGASNAVYQQRLEFVQAELDLEERTRQLRAARVQSENAITNALLEERLIRNEIETLDARRQRIAEQAEAKLKSQAITRQRLLQLEKERVFLTQQAQKATSTEEAEKLKDKIEEINQQIEARIAFIEREKQALVDLSTAEGFGGIDSTEFQEVLDLVQQIILQQATVSGNQENIREITSDIAELEEKILNNARLRAATIAVQETFEAKQRTKELQKQAEIEERLLRARSIFNTDPYAERLALAEEDYNTTVNKLEILKQEQASTLANLEAQRAMVAGTAQEADLLDQIRATQAQYNAELAVANAELNQAKQTLEETQAQAERGITTGIAVAFANFARDGLDSFTQTVNIMRNVFEGFVNFAVDSWASIWDPKNTQSSKERLGRFLLDISKQIIAMLTRIALVKSLLGLDLLFGSVDTVKAVKNTGNLGHSLIRHFGGIIPKADSKYSHFGPRATAQGLYRGGRPRGLHPKDTVPIWAQPGEFMMRFAAVRKYGLGVMDTINRGLVDPLALSALTGARKALGGLSAPRTPSFQTGGLISEQVGRAQETAQSPPEDRGASVGFIVANEDSMEMLLSSGSGAMERYIQKNAPTIRALLS